MSDFCRRPTCGHAYSGHTADDRTGLACDVDNCWCPGFLPERRLAITAAVLTALVIALVVYFGITTGAHP